jgi:hypothetical protein
LKSYTSGETVLDWTVGNKQKYSVTGDVTFAFTDPSNATNLVLLLYHTAAGSSIAFPGNVKWADGAEPDFSDAEIGDTDMVTFMFDGTNYYGMYARKFS